jgi:hypothetical protein
MKAADKRNLRNLNPHKPAVAARFLWGKEYAAQGGGSMDFWDRLDQSRKRLCRDLVERIKAAPDEVPA